LRLKTTKLKSMNKNGLNSLNININANNSKQKGALQHGVKHI